jgi:FkbM family methyltransferase
MRGVLRPGGVAVDAGAYKGGYTYWMREEVGTSGHVLAFEPQPALATFIRRAVKAFSWTNVDVEQAGLSAARGERTLHAPGSGPTQDASLVGALAGPDARHYTVRTETLDDFLDQRRLGRPVDFIKCDVEGHELDSFFGAEAVLTTDRPILLFECEVRHNPDRTVTEVFDYLQDLGYRGSFFWHGDLLDVRQFDLEAHQTLGRAPYANNFVFEPG